MANRFLSLMAVIIACAAGTTIGCSGRAVTQLNIDVLSFLSNEEQVVVFWLPPFGVYNFYFLPGLYIDQIEAGPDEIHKRGMLVDLPGVADAPPLHGITAEFSGAISVRNLNTSGILQLVTLSVVVGAADAANIYEEGIVVALVPVDPLGPGESAEAAFAVEITEDSLLAEILDTSSMRVGLKLTYPETTGEEMKAGFDIARIELSASTRPFLLLLN